jgi:hypothetical protein
MEILMAQDSTTRIGGSFAPPLDAKGLAAYRKLADDADPQVSAAMKGLADMVDLHRKGPDGGAQKATKGTPHGSGRGMVVPLPEEEVKRIWDAVPWQEELDMYATIFDRISDKPLRDAAFHLLWYGRELFLDRVPLTADQIGDLVATAESPESS